MVCGKHFQETIGTVFYGSSVPAEDIMHGIALLCEGVSPRKVARVYKVDKDTVLSWLVDAAVHSEAVLGYMLHDLHLSEVQMDELYALLSEMRGEEGERGRCWVWAAIDPISKLVLALEVGDRRLGMAQRLVHGVVSVLAPGVVPLFVTDQLAAYTKALLTHFGCWVERTSERSGRVLRRWVPDERLRYAQVRKRRVRHKIVAVSTGVVFGTSEAIHSTLRALGQKINTAYIERVNRTLRAHVPGLGRREEGLAKTEVGVAAAGDAGHRLLQSVPAAHIVARSAAEADSHQGQRFAEEVATTDASNGGPCDRPCLERGGIPAVPSSSVATGGDGGIGGGVSPDGERMESACLAASERTKSTRMSSNGCCLTR